jgi:hypothetical protein
MEVCVCTSDEGMLVGSLIILLHVRSVQHFREMIL